MGKIPRLRFPEFHGEWEEKKLGAIADRVMYGMNAAAIPFDGINKYLRITDINDDSRKFEANPLTSPSGEIEDKYKLQKGDIVFARTGASVGKSYLYTPNDGNLLFAGFLIRFSIINANPYFIFSQTLKSNYDKWIKKMSMRSGQPGINAEEYKELVFNIPSIAEQQKIADFLTLIDEHIEKSRKIINQLETAMRIIREKIFKQQMRFTREKTQWKELKLDDFTDIKKGEQLNKEDLTEKGIYPCLNGGVNFSGYTDKYNTNANTITISEGGNSCGYINFLTSNFWLGGHCYKIVPKSTINLIYFYHLLKFNEDKIMKLRVGSGLPNIQQKDLRNFKVSITVSSGEQTQIANSLASLDAKIETEKQLLEQYKQQKTYLLQNLFI